MKRNMKFLLVAASIFSAICLTSCDENTTIDIPGPAIEFTFNYSDLRSSNVSAWTLIAFDTIPGEDITAFLEKDSTNSKYADAVKAITIKNGVLSISGGDFNFAGVDSIKIVYKVTGSSVTNDLVVGAPDAEDNSVVNFNTIKFEKDQALEMMENEKIVSLYAIFNPLVVNCFQNGAVYYFTAETSLSVLATTALSAF